MRNNANSSLPVGARKLLLVALATGVFFVAYTLLVSPAPAEAGKKPKVEICHIPPGNPANFHTIKVSENAVPAHLAHGDSVGACNDLCAVLCNDGDPCTIDDTGDCESQGCPAAPRDQVDCNDSNPCTDEGTCDQETGACVNEPLPDILCTNSNPSVCEQTGEDNGNCNDAGACVPRGIAGCCTDDPDCDAADTDPCSTEKCDLTSNTCVPDGEGILDCTLGACRPSVCQTMDPPMDCSTSCRDCCCVDLPPIAYPCCEDVTGCDDEFDCTDDTCGDTNECSHVENCAVGTSCNAEGICEASCDLLPDSGQCVPAPNGLVAWWPFDADASDIQSGLDGVLNGAAVAGASGVVSGALSLDGMSDFVEVPDHPALTTPSGLTLDAWVNPTTFTTPAVIVSKYNSTSAVAQISWALARVAFMEGPGSRDHLRFVVCDEVYALCSGVDTIDPVLTEGCWDFVAATFDVATQAIKIYVNGAEVPTTSNGPVGNITSIANTHIPVQIGAITTFTAGGITNFWHGFIDEVEIYNQALSSSEILGIYSAGASGKCKDVLPPPPCGTEPCQCVYASDCPQDVNACTINTCDNNVCKNEYSCPLGTDCLSEATGGCSGPCWTALSHQGAGNDPATVDLCIDDCKKPVSEGGAGCPTNTSVGDICDLKNNPAFNPVVLDCLDSGPIDPVFQRAQCEVVDAFARSQSAPPDGGQCTNICDSRLPL